MVWTPPLTKSGKVKAATPRVKLPKRFFEGGSRPVLLEDARKWFRQIVAHELDAAECPICRRRAEVAKIQVTAQLALWLKAVEAYTRETPGEFWNAAEMAFEVAKWLGKTRPVAVDAKMLEKLGYLERQTALGFAVTGGLERIDEAEAKVGGYVAQAEAEMRRREAAAAKQYRMTDDGREWARGHRKMETVCLRFEHDYWLPGTGTSTAADASSSVRTIEEVVEKSKFDLEALDRKIAERLDD